MFKALIINMLAAILLVAAGPVGGENGKPVYKILAELPDKNTANAPNLALSSDYLRTAGDDPELAERELVAAINRWNNELYPHNGLAGQAYLLAVLMDPVTRSIRQELFAVTEGCTTTTEKIEKICGWTMSQMSHTQQHPKFAAFPGNDPWGIEEVSLRPTYRKLLPSEMAAMAFHTERISGKCMTLAHLIGSAFIQMGVDPDDLLFIHMRMKNYTHGAALLRYEGSLVAINNMAVVPAPFRNGTNPQPMELLSIYNHRMQVPFNRIMATGTMDSTLLATSRTVVEGFLDSFGLPHRLAQNRYPVDCDIGDPDALIQYVFESERRTKLTCLAKYAYQSLYVKHPGYYLTASLRTSAPRELAAELEGVDAVLNWIRGHIAAGSIFPDGPTRLMTADQVLVFQQGSPKDQAVLAYTVLKHQGHDPAVVLTDTDGYIKIEGKLYSLSTGLASEVPEKQIVFHLKAIEQFPGLDRIRRQARDLVVNGDIPAAIEALETAAKTYPGSWQVQEDLWFACNRLNQTEPAWNHLRQADILDPDNPDRLNRLAWLALERNDPKAAIRYCSRGLELEPENGYLKSNLIQGYLWSGRLDKAREYCRANAGVQLNGKPFNVVVKQDIEAIGEKIQVPAEVRGFAAALEE